MLRNFTHEHMLHASKQSLESCKLLEISHQWLVLHLLICSSWTSHWPDTVLFSSRGTVSRNCYFFCLFKVGLQPSTVLFLLCACKSSLASRRLHPEQDSPCYNMSFWQGMESIFVSGHFVLILHWSFSYEQQFHFSKLIIALKILCICKKESPQLQIEFNSLFCARVSSEEES